MKLLTGLIFLLISQQGFAQENRSGAAASRYFIMTGVIDKYPVTFHLYQTESDFSGVYYYNSTEKPIEIYGLIDKNHKLKLTHDYYTESDTPVYELFDGVFKDSAYSGTWTYKGKKQNFALTLSKDTSSLIFDYVWAKGKKKITNTEGRDTISFYAASIWPSATSTHPSIPLLQRIIRNNLGEKNSKDDIGTLLTKRKNETLNASSKALETGAPFELSDMVNVVYSNRNLLALRHFNYGDYGGAHGIYGTDYTCVDLVHNKQLKLSDILDTLAGKKTLESLLIRNFRKDFNMKPEDKLENMLLTDKIPVNDNFLLTGKGIAFNYTPYEIGAFSMGEITVFIPYKDINPYLKPGFKKLISQ